MYFEPNDVEEVRWGRPVKKKLKLWQFLAGNAKPKKRKERDAAYWRNINARRLRLNSPGPSGIYHFA